MIVDIQASNDRQIYPAADQYNDHFGITYNAGARIMSNSWGAPAAQYYTGNERVVDSFAYDHDDFTIIFAAGNDGKTGIASIGVPGSAKNLITVGATLSVPGKYEENTRPVRPVVNILDEGGNSITVTLLGVIH